ncbi:MAG TPA: hypothetical protein PKL31_17650 [Fulvivirga sp.]|nr:hypothetical protein [Fulvivirga sp.]
MKVLSFILLFTILISCDPPSTNQSVLDEIDSLHRRLDDAYKPGFGDFMSTIQTHHAKLWFAGQNNNWDLADFEIHELLETVEDIQKYQAGRKETRLLGMILPALDSVNTAIQQKDSTQFIKSYMLLTNTCNNCHKIADFDFNVVKVPDQHSFSNQDFKVRK